MAKHLRKPWWKTLNREWLPETIVIAVLLLAGVYFIIPATTQGAFLEGTKDFIQSVLGLKRQLLKPTNLIALMLIFGVIFFFGQRLRYHIFRFANYHQTCPVCSAKIKKQHRKGYQRLLSYYIPVRRYYCSSCGWKGLRVYNREKKH